ncbi:hypothetical protein LMG24076_01366 [Trinickia soli]|nr:hypothetical protein LMG24076_01366 [Trinickia soli]
MRMFWVACVLIVGFFGYLLISCVSETARANDAAALLAVARAGR